APGRLEDLDRRDEITAEPDHPHDAAQDPLSGAPSLDAPKADDRLMRVTEGERSESQLLPDGGDVAHVGLHALVAAIGGGALRSLRRRERAQYEIVGAPLQHRRQIA